MNKIASWDLPPRAPGFENSHGVTAVQASTLPAIGHQAMHTLERCVEAQHVAGVEYSDEEGRRSTIRLRPAYVRYNAAHHIVVWGIPTHAEHWEELRLDRIHSVRDTGKVFEPTW